MTTPHFVVQLPMAEDSESIKKRLFKSTMKGDWDEVKKLYKKHPETHKARITRSKDTALHIAVSAGNEEVVEQLVQLIQEQDSAVEALKIKNERGNTPLHLAASLGNVRMCQCIAAEDRRELIGIRNDDTETPFFLAALHGRKDAFLCLHSVLSQTRNEEAGYYYSRRNIDGETILHCAISGEYFGLAFQIIYLYKNLVNYYNEKGYSPLHLLASNPSAFESSSHIRGFEKIIRYCIFVEKLEFDQAYHHQPLLENQGDAKFLKIIELASTLLDDSKNL